jgi:uncharacterized protein
MTEICTDSPGEGDEPVEERSVEEQPVEEQLSDKPLATELPAAHVSRQEPSVVSLQPLDPAFVTIERISGWIFTGCLLFAGLIGMGVVAFNFGLTSIITGLSLLAYLLLGALLAWTTQVLPKKAHEHASWCLTPSGLEIRRGIWWRSQISVPLARVQHTDVHQGPLMRKFGLAKLIVHTAGTENSTVELNGLSFGTAQRLRDALIEHRGELDGV